MSIKRHSFGSFIYVRFKFYDHHHTNDQSSSKDHLSKKLSYNRMPFDILYDGDCKIQTMHV